MLKLRDQEWKRSLSTLVMGILGGWYMLGSKSYLQQSNEWIELKTDREQEKERKRKIQRKRKREREIKSEWKSKVLNVIVVSIINEGMKIEGGDVSEFVKKWWEREGERGWKRNTKIWRTVLSKNGEPLSLKIWDSRFQDWDLNASKSQGYTIFWMKRTHCSHKWDGVEIFNPRKVNREENEVETRKERRKNWKREREETGREGRRN